jgi:hypothetical protein
MWGRSKGRPLCFSARRWQAAGQVGFEARVSGVLDIASPDHAFALRAVDPPLAASADRWQATIRRSRQEQSGAASVQAQALRIIAYVREFFTFGQLTNALHVSSNYLHDCEALA